MRRSISTKAPEIGRARPCRIRCDVEQDDIAVPAPFARHQRRAVLKDRIGLVVQIEGRLCQNLTVDVDVLRDCQPGKGAFIREGAQLLRFRPRE